MGYQRTKAEVMQLLHEAENRKEARVNASSPLAATAPAVWSSASVTTFRI
ncbi:MAG: hypothetical protein ACREQ4_06205 [Candidatus Binataceae bacterium]